MVNPDPASLASRRARDVVQAKDPEQMLQALVRYLEVVPGNAVAWTDLAGIFMALRRYDEALDASDRALAIDPLQPMGLLHRGTACMKQERLEEAEEALRKLVTCHPGRVEGIVALAEFLIHKQDLDAAKEVLDQAVQLEPANLKVHQFRGQVFYEQGRWTDFQAELDRFRRENPTSDYLEFETGFRNLLHGAMVPGWRQWEARLRVPGATGPERHFPQPTWDGSDFHGKTLLVHYEQGFGDTVMLARFLPQVKARGGRVLLLAQPAIAGLMTTCAGVDQVLAEGDALPAFDLQVPIYSLPAVLKVELATVPAEVPYLGIPAQVPNRTAIAQVLAESEGTLRIGLAWAGSPKHRRDRERSLPPRMLERFAVLPEVSWYGFQLGTSEQPALPRYVTLAPLLGTFSDSAYALASMDLVISVDTAIAHLAGAMGIPTFLLVTYVPDFRWMLDRGDSPWYPTLRIYRQERPGDWESAVQKLMDDLAGGAG